MFGAAWSGRVAVVRFFVACGLGLAALGGCDGKAGEDLVAQETRYTRALRQDADNTAARYGLGEVYFKQGHFRKALTAYLQVLQADSNHVGALVGRGRVHFKEGEFAQAIDNYGKALAADPGHSGAHRALGAVYLRQERYTDAQKAYEQALAIEPDHAPSHYNLGVALSQQSSYEAATGQMEKAIQLDPDYILAYTALGDILCLKLGRCQRAGEVLRQAIARDPGWAPLHVALGRVYLRQGRQDEAARVFEQGIALDSTAAAFNGLGMARAGLGENERALQALLLAIRLNPLLPEAYYNLSRMYQKLGQVREGQAAMQAFKRVDAHTGAINRYQTVLEGNPHDALARYELGVVYSNLGMPLKAVDELARSLAVNPANISAWHNLGSAYARLKRLDEAIAAYERALKLDEGYVLSWYNLGNAFFVKGELVQAREAFQQALSLKPDYADAYHGLGGVALRAGAFEDAVDHFQAVLRADSSHAMAHYGLAMAYRSLQDTAAAKREMQAFKQLQGRRPAKP